MAVELLIFDPPLVTTAWGDRPPLVVSGSGTGFAGLNQITRIVTTASGGSFTMNPNSLGATASISGSASASTIQAALEATAAIVPGDVTVTGGPLGSGSTPVFIEWTGQFAQGEVFLVNNLTGTTGFAVSTTQVAIPASALSMEELDLTPPASKPDWVAGADSEWQALADIPKHENRKITLKVRVAPDAGLTQDQAFDELGSLIDRVRSAQSDVDGVAMQWTPTSSARSVIFDVLNGDFTGLPIDWQTDPGWFLGWPFLNLELTCKPYWRDSVETVTSATTAATPVVSMEVTAGGDVPALGRIIVTDNATQTRRDVEWGFESEATYNSATSLTLDSDNLVTSGFAGTGTTRSGAYDPGASGNSVIRASTVLTTPIAVCGTGAQSHIGSYRVWARCFFARQTQAVRLAWRVGDGPYAVNAWAVKPDTIDSQWAEVDLGTITVPELPLSTQRWDGRIEAFENAPYTATPGALDVDYLRLTPTRDGYGRATAPFAYIPGTAINAYDEFTGATSTLSGRSAPVGGSWATSGSTTDFTQTNLGTAGDAEARSTTGDTGSGRWAILGSTNYTDTEVRFRCGLSVVPGFATGSIVQTVVARYVDSSNWLTLDYTRTTSYHTLNLVQSVAGLIKTIAWQYVPMQWSSIILRLIAYASGFAVGQMVDITGTTVLNQIAAYSADLKTGGALDDGKPGIRDFSAYTGANTAARIYDGFAAATPAPEPVVLNSGQSMQFRDDGLLRYNSNGTYVGQPPSYRGTRVTFPPGTGRVAVAARRVSLSAMSDDNVTDSTTIQVGVRDRGLVVPR